jgi:hypothetical protein
MVMNSATEAKQVAPIPFTQFMRPNGRQVDVSIDRPADIAAKAQSIIDRGFRFECEHLTTNEVSLTIAGKDDDLDIEICANGPGLVGPAVDRLIERAHAALTKAGAA